MAIGIGDNVSKSFGYAKERLFGNWIDWIILIILCIIPIIGWLFLAGFIVRVYRGGEAKLGDWVKMLIDGICIIIIDFIYMLIPMIVLCLFGGGAILGGVIASMNPMAPLSTVEGVMAGVGIIGFIVTLIVAIIFGIMGSMAAVRFAKEDSIGAAFQFGEIFKIVGKIGWVHYILSCIVLWIIMCIIAFIFALLAIVIIGLLLAFIFVPYLLIVEARFFAQLYETA